MAFNVKDFIKDSAKSPVEQIIDTAVASASNGQPNGLKGIAEATAKSFFDVASSYEAVSAFSSAKTDSIVSGAADEYFAFAGKSSERASKGDLSRLRRLSSQDVNTFLSTVNPVSKIGAVKKGNTIDIISVL